MKSYFVAVKRQSKSTQARVWKSKKVLSTSIMSASPSHWQAGFILQKQILRKRDGERISTSQIHIPTHKIWSLLCSQADNNFRLQKNCLSHFDMSPSPWSAFKGIQCERCMITLCILQNQTEENRWQLVGKILIKYNSERPYFSN